MHALPNYSLLSLSPSYYKPGEGGNIDGGNAQFTLGLILQAAMLYSSSQVIVLSGVGSI